MSFNITLSVCVVVMAIMVGVVCGFRVNGFVRRTGDLCCTLPVSTTCTYIVHIHYPYPTSFPFILPPSLPPSLPLPSLPPSLSLSLPSPSPSPLCQTYVFMLAEYCGLLSSCLFILLSVSCFIILSLYKVGTSGGQGARL